TVFDPVPIDHKPKPRQPKTYLGTGQRHIGYHPRRVAVITTPRFFPNQRDIGLTLSGTGKQTGGGKGIAADEDINLSVEMVGLARTEVMPFEMPKMIKAIFLPVGSNPRQQTVCQPVIDIPVVPAVPADGIERVCQLELFVDKITRQQGREGGIAPAVRTDVDDEIFYVLVIELLKGMPEKAPQMIAVLKSVEREKGGMGRRIHLQVTG